jgi:hypothetical protein
MAAQFVKPLRREKPRPTATHASVDQAISRSSVRSVASAHKQGPSSKDTLEPGPPPPSHAT